VLSVKDIVMGGVYVVVRMHRMSMAGGMEGVNALRVHWVVVRMMVRMLLVSVRVQGVVSMWMVRRGRVERVSTRDIGRVEIRAHPLRRKMIAEKTGLATDQGKREFLRMLAQWQEHLGSLLKRRVGLKSRIEEAIQHRFGGIGCLRILISRDDINQEIEHLIVDDSFSHITSLQGSALVFISVRPCTHGQIQNEDLACL